MKRRGFEAVREITAILVSWEDAEEVYRAVESLAAARDRIPPRGPRASLVVVDNSGAAFARDAILSLWPAASLIINSSNVGFASAANQAAEIAPGDVLLFLNPDTRTEGEVFSTIAHAFSSRPQVVAVAPRLTEWDGTARPGRAEKKLSPPGSEDQFTFQLRRLPTLRADARELLLIDHLLPNNAGRRHFRYADFDREAPFEVEQAAAAALAVRKSAFRAIGGFDEEFFPAWFEDVDLCARVSREGKILYWPEARFRHRGGLSSARLGYRRFLPIFYRNALRYRRRHYRRGERLAYRVLLILGMVARLLALPLRREMPRSPLESARAYLAVLRLALRGKGLQ